METHQTPYCSKVQGWYNRDSGAVPWALKQGGAGQGAEGAARRKDLCASLSLHAPDLAQCLVSDHRTAAHLVCPSQPQTHAHSELASSITLAHVHGQLVQPPRFLQSHRCYSDFNIEWHRFKCKFVIYLLAYSCLLWCPFICLICKKRKEGDPWELYLFWALKGPLQHLKGAPCRKSG